MLKQLRIQNFKGWEDTGSIRMAPLTLFFGTNSSGKSSIGQFLMMLKQTVESPDRRIVFNPGGKNSAVQLGSYQEMVYMRDRDKKISFDYQWSLPEMMKIKDPLTVKNFSGNLLSFQAIAGLADKEYRAPFIEQLGYELHNSQEFQLSVGMKIKNNKSEYEVISNGYKLKRNQGRAWPPSSSVRFYGFPDEVLAYHKNAYFVQELNLYHENLFRSIYYLGPLRNKAERLYLWTGIEPESVGYFGENTIAALLAAQERKINFGYKRTSSYFGEIIALKLKEMGLIENFKAEPISKQRSEYRVQVQTKGSGYWVDLPDVGFGISQVLPVLIQCFYAPPNSIILMEQPEIHLHPNAQSVLADVMIDVINSRENNSDKNIQLIIETHSEHFLRRLQRRIAENAVPQEKVSAYFANNTVNPARLEPLEIDEYGSIKNWPENFFGDEMGDITEQSKAALKRRVEKKKEVDGLR